jgi:anti-sigma B factor antagonist
MVMTFEALPEPVGGTTVLRATGELDIAVVPALLPDVPALVETAESVVLDLSDVTFFDSSGVRFLDRVASECGRRETPFRVAAPPGTPPRRVLELVGLADTLADDDLAAAIRAVHHLN